MPIRAHTCPGEALLFIHSFRHRLRVTEICSHDANITMATVVARRPSVLQLACSHEQTALQVAIDASTLSQEDSRIAIICLQTVQHTLTIIGCVQKLCDWKSLHSIRKSLLHNHCTIKCILSQNNVSTVPRIK